MKVSIFIEGKEKNFLESLIKHIGKSDSLESITIVNIGGWTNLKKIDNKLLDNQRSDIKNIIIFDADSEYNNGGFAKRKNEIEEILKGFGIDCKLFLFPNNRDNGDFELLLEKIINQDHIGLLDCFCKYEVCISKYKNEDGSNKYAIPIRKAKMYSYIDAFPKTRKEKENFKNKDDWFFNDKSYWNLDASYLNDLKVFLSAEID